jgi:hypothetical protein
MSPENLGGGEGNSQEISQGFGLPEKLHMSRVNDVVATGDKNVTHRGVKRWRGNFDITRIDSHLGGFQKNGIALACKKGVLWRCFTPPTTT